MFSFIIGEGSSQLAWLSITGFTLLSIGLLQIHSTNHECVCMCGSRQGMSVHGLTQYGALSEPSSTTRNSDELQLKPDWHALQMCVCVCCCLCVCVFVHLCKSARQVGVNPIRLTRFKSCRPAAPKPVMWRSSHEYTTFSIPISLQPHFALTVSFPKFTLTDLDPMGCCKRRFNEVQLPCCTRENC